MSNKFADGVVVQLNSGGPVMTVSHYDEESEQYLCEWFVKDEIKRAHFNEASLTEYKVNWE